MPLARISLTLSRHSSLSFIAPGRSSGLHPISSQSCYMYVWAGRSAFVRPYERVRRSTSLMSSYYDIALQHVSKEAYTKISRPSPGSMAWNTALKSKAIDHARSRTSFQPPKLSGKIWLLYCNQLHLHIFFSQCNIMAEGFIYISCFWV